MLIEKETKEELKLSLIITLIITVIILIVTVIIVVISSIYTINNCNDTILLQQDNFFNNLK